MKKVQQNSVSIKTIMNHITCEMYTKQTLVSLFRCLVETIIESGNNAVILFKINYKEDFQGLMNRLKYSEAKVYDFSEVPNFSENKDEFLVIVADRFTACLYWERTISEIMDLYQGFCSLNPDDSKKIIDLIIKMSPNKNLSKNMELIKQDRRSNVKFNSILNKFIESFENQQRDLICANTELQEMRKKTSQHDNLISIGKLSSIIAHEIRNPLGMLDMYNKIIKHNLEKIENPEVKNNIDNGVSVIGKTIANLENLLTEILNYSKPQVLNKINQKIKPVIENAIKLAEPLFVEKGVQLLLNCELAENTETKLDFAKIEQAIINLLKNALEVSSKGDIVEVNAKLNNAVITIEIKDQGQGLKPEEMEKLFIPFYTTKEKGTGLGLAQVKNTVEEHGGKIKTTSTEGFGTTFEIILPVD